MQSRSLMLALLAGTASVASAQTLYTVNLSGATLLQNFIRNAQSTTDVIDVDGNGVCRFDPVFCATRGTQQLVSAAGDNPGSLTPGTNSYWVVQYRSVGSVNGVRSLARYGRPTLVYTVTGSAPSGAFRADARGIVAGPRPELFGDLAVTRVETQSWQHRTFVNNGATNPYPLPTILSSTDVSTPARGGFNVNGLPNMSTVVIDPNAVGDPNQGYTAVAFPTGGASNGGVYQVDIAPVDVPTSWTIRSLGTTPAAQAKPNSTTQGYGRNDRVATDKAGNVLNSNDELNRFDLVELFAEGRNLNLSSPDENTIYDTTFTFAPVALFVNRGVNESDFTMGELRHLMGAGRLPNGENLTAVTRSVGSGTHNAFMNSVGLDPSFGVGEAIGPESTPADQHVLGATYVPGNKQGSGLLETTLRNTRLGLAYSGAERGVNPVGQRQYDIARVQADGGTDFVRPEIDRLLNNGLRGQTDPDGGTYAIDGWRIGGPAIFATLGDPRSRFHLGGDAGNNNPNLDNEAAARYVNNITRSIEALAAAPSCPLPPAAARSPAEVLVNSFLLVAATDRVQATNDPQSWLINPAPTATRAALASLYQTCPDALSTYRNLAIYDSTTANRPALYDGYQSPRRRSSTDVVNPFAGTYTDGQNSNYITLDGETIAYNVRMDQAPVTANAFQRNRVAGDFNGDGARNVGDLAEMVAAWRARNGGPAWDGGDVEGGTISAAVGQKAIIEMLGDHDGDGNFTAGDVRYAADGLAISTMTGNLNRAAGFLAVDNAFPGGNFFGTALSTGAAYPAGGSAADVAGNNTTRGFAPVGADGNIDRADITYIYSQFIQFSDLAANWSDLDEAVEFDLSADVNGDLIVNCDDIAQVYTILQTTRSDINLDGQCDFFDFLDFATAFDAAGQDPSNLEAASTADYNCDGQVDFFDYLDFAADFSNC
ncbi:MAG: hypothetical protein SFZ23_12795 [Planctomycetota bacterium]|nr:hypothetical protein [Planctomycetota bacterium]